MAYDADADLDSQPSDLGVTLTSLENVALCDVIVLAVPVSCFEEILTLIAPICRPGSTVVDVGSVKMQPALAMEQILPSHVNVVATHPLFGPESASVELAGLKNCCLPCPGKSSQIAFKLLPKTASIWRLSKQRLKNMIGKRLPFRV